MEIRAGTGGEEAATADETTEEDSSEKGYLDVQALYRLVR